MTTASRVEPPSTRPTDARAPGGSQPPAGGWGIDVLWVVGLSAVFVALFVLLREPPVIYDSIEYFAMADRLEQAAPFHRSLRSGLLLPVRAAQELFGYSQAAFYAVPLLSGLGLLASTYALGRMLFTRGVGIAAGVLVVLTPPVFDSVHQIWPDLPAAAVFTGAMAVLVGAGRWLERDPAPPSALVHVVFVGVGLLFGWSYLIREFTVILAPVALLPFLLLRVPWRYLVNVAAGALVMLGFELAYNQLLHDDPFIRIRDLVTKRSQEPAPHTLDLIQARIDSRGGIVGRLRVLPDQLSAGRAGPLLLAVGALGLLSPWLQPRPRRRAAVMLVLWVAGYWAVVTYMSLSADEFGRALHIEKARYWYPALPALVIAGCAGVAGLVERLRAGVARRVAVAAVGLVVVGVLALEFTPRIAALDGAVEPHEYEQLRRWLATEGAEHDSIATTQRAAWTVRMYTTSPFGRPVWDGRVEGVNAARRFVDLAGVDTDLVLVDDRFFEPRRSNWREVTPAYLVDPPADWTPVAVTDGSGLVVYEPGARAVTARTTTVPAASWALPASDGDRVTTTTATDTVGARVGGGAGESLGVVLDDAVATGDVLVAELDVSARGDGNVVPFCYFSTEGSSGVRTDASSTWGLGLPTDPVRAQFTCTPPVSVDGPATARLVLRLNGPVEVEVGGVDVTVVGTSTSWRTD